MNRFLKMIGAVAITLIAGMAHAQHIATYNADQLMSRVRASKDTFYVINFWATWCGPCVRELPEFDKLPANVNGKPVKVLLVSLDFKKDYPAKVQNFINNKKLKHEVVWFTETNANEFIPKISNEWQGSIPATLLVYGNKGYTNFYEGMIKSKTLTKDIKKNSK